MKRKTPGPVKNAKKPVPVQDARLAGLELDARRDQRLKASDILKAARTPLTIVAIAHEATTIADSAVQKAKQIVRSPSLACKEGCDWCCHLDVGTSVPEVIRIADYLRQTQSSEELQAIRDRLRKRHEMRRERLLVRRNGTGLPCALLVDHRCTVYPVRPLTCRGANSTDSKACERFLQEPKRTVIPNYAPQHRIAAFVLDGTRAGISESGLKGESLELTAALRIALEEPDAAERWLAGEPVFEQARLD
jgi:Fe-S-cluster containining protein